MKLSERMKLYEHNGTKDTVMPLLPIMIRLDGRKFSKWTKNLQKPFDSDFAECMQKTTQRLIEETNAKVGYTQSDEITLCLYHDKIESEPYFGGKLFKIQSVLAGLCALWFNAYAEEKKLKFPKEISISFNINNFAAFDCRVWNVPSLDEAVNVFVWREQDASRNSIQMAASSVFSHKELLGKSTKVMQEMLFSKGINWNDYDDHFKRGSYYQRISYEKDGAIRHKIERLDLRPIVEITNRVNCLIHGEVPLYNN